MTSSSEIENFLRDEKGFLGCFAYDDLPPFPKILPASMIINTHEKNQPGEHWLGLVLTRTKCFYFDSFGAPIMEKTIINYLKQEYKKVIINNECIQHFYSASCGLFCIAFVRHVNSRLSFEKFISHFDLIDLHKNDNIVKKIL